MRVMNKARTMMLEWGEAFLPIVSQGFGKAIVQGYQEMMNEGIRFPPLTESNKWTPCLQLVASEKPVSSDVKDFYRHIKRAMGTIEETGVSYFKTDEGAKVLEECRRRLPEMDVILKSTSEESTLQHVKKLKEMCRRVIELGEKVDDDWSEDERSEDVWDDEEFRDERNSKGSWDERNSKGSWDDRHSKNDHQSTDIWNDPPSQNVLDHSHNDSRSQKVWEETREPNLSSEWESEPVVTIRKTRKRSVHSEPPKKENEVIDFMDM